MKIHSLNIQTKMSTYYSEARIILESNHLNSTPQVQTWNMEFLKTFNKENLRILTSTRMNAKKFEFVHMAEPFKFDMNDKFRFSIPHP